MGALVMGGDALVMGGDALIMGPRGDVPVTPEPAPTKVYIGITIGI